MPVSKSDLYRASGNPIRGLDYTLSEFGCETLDQLEARVALGEVTFEMFFNARIKGNGSRWNPGRLARYLFKIEKKKSPSKFLGFYWAWLSPTGKLLPSTIRRKAGDSDDAFSGTDQKYRLKRIGKDCTQIKVRVTQVIP